MKQILSVLFAWSVQNHDALLVSSFLTRKTSCGSFARRKQCSDSIYNPVYQRQCLSPASGLFIQTQRNNGFNFLLATAGEDFVTADDLEALQALFSKYCDSEGLMTKKATMKVPAIADLLAEEDLLPEEFDDIWDRAPKFPETAVGKKAERIDVDSWVQLYRDIDDLFEDVEEEETTATAVKQLKVEEKDVTVADETSSDDDDAEVAELKSIFEVISDKDGLLSKEMLGKWEEIQKLLAEGLLDNDEFEGLWKKTKTTADKKLDLKGFLEFNAALDSLFEFDEEDDMDEETEVGLVTEEPSSPRMVNSEGLDADTLFIALADANGLVGKDELKLWSELQEMLAEEDLLQSELDDIYSSIKKSEQDLRKLDQDGFVALYNAIDELFVEEGEEEELVDQAPSRSSRKGQLLEAIESLDNEGLLPCGLEASEREQKAILALVEEIEAEQSNLVRQRQGAIEPADLAGDWDMIYSSSSAMKFNKGLSGLGGSFPNGKFDNLKQKLTASKFLTDVEYIEHIKVTPSSASFDVTVTGTWDLRTSMSLFTGEPSIVMTVVPDRVTYGPTSTRADHWKSLGPMNMLDISYLDDDLRIMRGNTAVDTVFIFRRSS